MSNKKIGYTEPKDYFPKEIRKKYGIGEYSKTTTKKTVKKPNKRK